MYLLTVVGNGILIGVALVEVRRRGNGRGLGRGGDTWASTPF
jgi:hypothetical protein